MADEMGMEKTIQAIALVLAKREVLRTIDEPNGSSLTPTSSTDLPILIGTLVICPVVVVSQWVNESIGLLQREAPRCWFTMAPIEVKLRRLYEQKETNL